MLSCGTGGKEPADEAIIETRVELGTAVLDDARRKSSSDASSKVERTALIAMPNRMSVSKSLAEDHGEIGAGEGADATFGNNNFAFLWGDFRWARSKRSLKQLLTLRRGLNCT